MSVGCRTLDPDPPKTESYAYRPCGKGILAQTAGEADALMGPGQSGFVLLEDPKEALNWRLALVDHATQSIDIQYYLWDADEAGLLLFSRIMDAADRGVRVRILVDDFLYGGEEEQLAALCLHPNVQIRLYNPQFYRDGTLGPTLEILTRFTKLNRRMHNKLFLVDNQVAIMGGRNIGNNYFGLSEEYNFLDLDVMTVGAVIPDISEGFDVFWNSDPAYPGSEMAEVKSSDAAREVRVGLQKMLQESNELLRETPYPISRKDWSREFASLRSQWHVGSAVMLQDSPDTDTGGEGARFLDLSPQLVTEGESDELVFVSPYLIPEKKVYDSVENRVAAGIRVRLMAPSMNANNHLIVHSHFKKHRKRLIEKGVELTELRGDANDSVRALADVAPVRSAKVGLHVKTGVGDRRKSYIGSLNLDPRSIKINTENGLLIDCPGLSQEVYNYYAFLSQPDNAWQVSVDDRGHLVWRSRGEEVYIQPAPDMGSRIKDFFYGMLPIGGML